MFFRKLLIKLGFKINSKKEDSSIKFESKVDNSISTNNTVITVGNKNKDVHISNVRGGNE
ncbi:hypothetical protein IB680_08125 [Francisella philomiragia]|uniref:hypothetical protein n=1 Tax=Francisella philomiragia TaxID=28110 RepID=UPI000B58936B|nr:hypothetical protein [Francisella philomiragia]MBK2095643.1 hypothetical protein [Francisella philomiragia]